MTKFTYSVKDDEKQYSIDAFFNKDNVRWTAEEAAEDYERNHDGWGRDWPIVFSIYHNKELLGAFSVERVYIPTFHATRGKE